MQSSQINFGQMHLYKPRFGGTVKVLPVIAGKYLWVTAAEVGDITSVSIKQPKKPPVTITFDGFGLRPSQNAKHEVWVLNPRLNHPVIEMDGVWISKDLTIPRGIMERVSVRHLHGNIEEHTKNEFILEAIGKERAEHNKEMEVLTQQLSGSRDNLTAALKSIIYAKHPQMRPALGYAEKNPFKLFASEDALLQEMVFVYLKFLRKTEVINDSLADSFNSALTTFEGTKKIVGDAAEFDVTGATTRAMAAWEAQQGGVSP
jgi:hypothetical protein